MSRVLKIIQEGEAVLRKKAEPVKDPKAPEIQKLIDDMIATMKEVKGLGLAAPQVGKSLRLFMAEVEEKIYVFINPEIKDLSKEKAFFEEGCLSVQNTWGPVLRPKKLSIKGLDRAGKPVKMRAKGLLARVIQHEMDHLSGTLFIDKAEEIFTVQDKDNRQH